MRRDDAIRIITAHLDEIRALGVAELSLFGSVARDEARDDSDVDVLVSFEGKAAFASYMGLKCLLEELFGTKVDLATSAMIREPIKRSVGRDLRRVA